MKALRSITYTYDFNKIIRESYQSFISKNIDFIKNKYNENDYFVRTLRLNSVFLNNFIDDEEKFLEKIDALSYLCESSGIRWFSVSFELIAEEPSKIKKITDLCYYLLSNYDNIFINLSIANGKINPVAVNSVSCLIKSASNITNDGITNFRLGLSANVLPNTPFFPFSFSDTVDSFSIAVETTNTVSESISNSNSTNLVGIREDILFSIQNIASDIDYVAKDICKKIQVKYNGQDLSLSPFPPNKVSVVLLLKQLGVDVFGSSGTQAMTAFLSSILKTIVANKEVKTVGFNGVMYSLLEDFAMVDAIEKGNITIDNLLLYSTVCGCGLDMIPLPSDITKNEINSIIFDIAFTASRLDKPLGIRLLPIPNKKTLEYTMLDLDFIVNSKILTIKDCSISNKFMPNELFSLN